jgi:hypothetical protein
VERVKGISKASSNSASYTHQSSFAKIVWSAVLSRDIADTTPGVSRRSEDQISQEIRKKILDGWGLLHLLSEALHAQAGRESIVQDYPRVPRRAESMLSDQISTALQSLLSTMSEDKGGPAVFGLLKARHGLVSSRYTRQSRPSADF